MNRKEAEDYIYKSYLKAEEFQDYNAKDALKRNPQFSKDIIESLSKTPCAIVTGSKGKGSVSVMISQILQSQKKVGLMTSPHLEDICERFKVNNCDISNDAFSKHMIKTSQAFDSVENQLLKNEYISPIGIQTVLGLNYFNEENTEFNVLECGKGARYDDVNNVIHEYAVINTIFLEHTRELGATLEEIAEDKASVITGNQQCVYTALQEPEVLTVIKKRANDKNVLLKIYGEDFFAKEIRYTKSGMIFDVVIENEQYSDIEIPLLGEHQARNCALAFALCKDVLGEINLDLIKEKLRNLQWPGRMEVLSANPFVLLDACINRESCIHVLKVLEKLSLQNITAIVGVPDDKDFFGVIEAVKEIAEGIILTKANNPHYKFSKYQEQVLEAKGIPFLSTSNIKDALEIAIKKGRPVVILGTTALISEVFKTEKSNFNVL